MTLTDHLFPSSRIHRKSTWGTCAGLILLSESANKTKKGGQDLIGGLDVRVNRNHFGRQAESFQAPLNLPFLETNNEDSSSEPNPPFHAVFIRAPVVEKILQTRDDIQHDEQGEENIVAPSSHNDTGSQVEILATLPGRAAKLVSEGVNISADKEAGDIVAVKQGNVFGTSFHPELTQDARIHSWWLNQVQDAIKRSKGQQ